MLVCFSLVIFEIGSEWVTFLEFFDRYGGDDADTAEIVKVGCNDKSQRRDMGGICRTVY